MAALSPFGEWACLLRPFGRFFLLCLLTRCVLYDLTTMLFKIGDQGAKLRIAHKVDTVDSQYDIVDFGYQNPDGGIDSLAVGGSFYSLKKAIKRANDDASAAPATAAEPELSWWCRALPVTNYDGAEVDIEGL